jgi:hypothetical protein
MGAEKIAVKVTSEEGRELVIESPDGKEETYYRNPIRTMYLDVVEVQVCSAFRQYSFEHEEGKPQPLPELALAVRGTATLEGCSISVIGDPGSESRKVAISFRTPNETTPEELDETEPAQEKLTRCHSVILGFNRRDWEIGNEDTWFVDCEVSQATLDTLVNAVSVRRMRNIKVGLHLHDIYSDDDWAPPSGRADWFIRPSKRDNTIEFPELARGEIANLYLTMDTVDLRPRADDSPETVDEEKPEPAAEPAPDQQAMALQMLALHIEKLRVTVKWVGGFIAVFLAILAFR